MSNNTNATRQLAVHSNATRQLVALRRSFEALLPLAVPVALVLSAR